MRSHSSTDEPAASSPHHARHPRSATRAWASVCGLALAGTVLAGCASDAGDDDAAGGAPAAEGSSPIPDTSDAADADRASGEDGSGSGDASGQTADEAFATATWDGASYEYSTVSCRDEAVLGQMQMLATGGDAPTLTVLIEYPGGEQDPDLSQPSRIELFFPEGGGTVGDSEGYEARGEDITGVAASATGASGSLMLGPDEDTAASQTNPEGGRLDFELACG